MRSLRQSFAGMYSDKSIASLLAGGGACWDLKQRASAPFGLCIGNRITLIGTTWKEVFANLIPLTVYQSPLKLLFLMLRPSETQAIPKKLPQPSKPNTHRNSQCCFMIFARKS